MSELSFETDGTGALAAGAGAGDADVEGGAAAPDSSAADVSVGEPSAEQAAPPWTPDPAAFQRIEQGMNYLLELASSGQEQEQELLQLDPYDESFPQTLEERLTRMQQSISDHLTQALAPIQQDRAEAWLEKQTAGLDLTDPSRELLKGAGMSPEVLGNEQAFKAMAGHVARIEKAAFDKGRAAYIAEMQQLAGARSEPGSGVTAATETGAPVTSLLEAAQRINSRRTG